MDAGAIMQDDTSIGEYAHHDRHGAPATASIPPVPTSRPHPRRPAICRPRSRIARSSKAWTVVLSACAARRLFPWEERVKDLPEITGSPELVRKIWEDIDAFGNMYIWQLLLSF